VVLLVVVFVAEARYFNEDAISYGLNGNEAALRRSPPRGDLKLLQLPSSTDLPQLPQSLPPLRRADQIPSTTDVAPPLEMLQLPSKALPQQLPSLETSQASLKTQIDQIQNDDALTLASLAETEKQAVKARQHSAIVKTKKKHLLSLAAKLQAKLKAALSKSMKTQQQANQVSKKSFAKVRTAHSRTEQNQRAQAMQSQLLQDYQMEQTRLAQSKEKVAEIDKAARRKAKYRVKLAEEEAQELVQQAEAKAAALKKQAHITAKRGIAQAQQQEQELQDDARSELAVTKRKLRRVKKILAVTRGLSDKAQGRAWSSMSAMQQLRRDEEKAKAEVSASKEQLGQVQQQINTLA